MDDFMYVKKKGTPEQINRRFLETLAGCPSDKIIQILSGRMKKHGCEVSLSEQIDAIHALAAASSQSDGTVEMMKSGLRNSMSKSAGCAKAFDEEWDETFKVEGFYNQNDKLSPEEEAADKFVRWWLSEVANAINMEAINHHHLRVSYNDFKKLSMSNELDLKDLKEVDEEKKDNFLPTSIKIFNECKLWYEKDGNGEDGFLDCMKESALVHIKQDVKDAFTPPQGETAPSTQNLAELRTNSYKYLVDVSRLMKRDIGKKFAGEQ